MNKHKQDLRGRKNEIVQLNGTINNLNGTITQQRTQIGTLEEEKKALGFQISDLNREVDKLTQDNATLSNDVQRLVQRIEHLTRGVEGRKDGEEAKQTRRQLYITNIQPGQKGQIASVNEQWNFVVVQLSEPFLKEIMGEDLKAAPPQVDLFVKRSDSTFVTKVRLLQVDSGKQIGVADILKEWQQKPVQKGDVLFY
jgi:cell division protein FtsB